MKYTVFFEGKIIKAKIGLFIFTFFMNFQVSAQVWKFYEQKSGRNVPMGIIETYDHGLVFPVFNPDITQYFDISLYKLNVNGDLIWKKNYGYNQSYFETCGILELKNGTYLLWGSVYAPDTGDESGNPFILKLNQCFEPEWFNIYYEPLSYNRIDYITEYNGNLLVSFAYLDENHITMALLDNQGNFIKKRTISEIFTNDVLIDNKGSIMVLGSSGLFGLFNNPDIGIDKGFMITMDSNLNVLRKYYFHEKDTGFPNLPFGMCFTDDLRNNYLTLGSHRAPNPNNTSIDGSVMISRNYNDTDWYKIINDTSFYTSGESIIRLSDNRFAISSYHNPDLNNPFLYYGKIYLIDSNANILFEINENPGTQISRTCGIVSTYDSKLVSLGTFNRSGDNWDIFCYKYNEDLSSYQKTNIQKSYDTLCNKNVTSTSVQLMSPKIINLFRDSFLIVKRISDEINSLIRVYPNPAIQKVKISSKIEFKLTVYNIHGQLISAFENINEVSLPPGIYYFYFRSGEFNDLRKVIIF